MDITPNRQLAALALKRHPAWRGEELDCDEADENGNHIFYFGEVKYDWNGLDSEWCVNAVLRPIVENGELVNYEVVSVEQVA